MVGFENQNVSEAETFGKFSIGLRTLLKNSEDISPMLYEFLKESFKIRNKGIQTLVRYYLIFYTQPVMTRLIYGEDALKSGYKYPSLYSIKKILRVGHNLAIDLRKADDIITKSLRISQEWGEIIKRAGIAQANEKVRKKNEIK